MKNKLLVSIVALGLIACGKAPNTPDGGSGGGTGGSAGGRAGGSGGSGGGGTGGATGGGTGGTGGTGGMGGGMAVAGSSCATPIMQMPTGNTISAFFNTAGKKIHYRVPVTAGDFLSISTSANPADELNIDPTVSVYNEAGTMLLATIDDAFPRSSTDAQLFYRTPTTGNVCVVVMDFATWAGMGTSTTHAEDIKLRIGKLNSMAMINNEDTGSNDTAAMAQVGKIFPIAMTSGGIANVYGMLESAADVDVYKFTVPATAGTFGVSTMPVNTTSNALGTNSYGSSLSHVNLKITDITGNTVLGQLSIPTNVDEQPDSISVPAAPSSEVLLWIERPAGVAAGANDFYAVLVDTFGDNPPETMDSANNVEATAEPLAFTVDTTNVKLRRAFITGTMSSATDVDIYSLPAGVGDQLSLLCLAHRTGSGLRGATFAIASDGGTIQEETETQTADVQWFTGTGGNGSRPSVTFTDAGTYFFRVKTTSIDTTNTSAFYRCGMSVLSP